MTTSKNYHRSDKQTGNSFFGLNHEQISRISALKREPAWMLGQRLKALEIFESKPMPTWGADLSELDPQNICYYLKKVEKPFNTWQEVPEKIKTTFEKLGVPQAEREWLAGVNAQVESELVYKKIKDEWANKGVVFTDISDALVNYEDLIKQYFGSVVPAHDNKFAALNTAVWSGGSFVYIPKGVRVDMPLQAYFRIDQERMGQFERTLIIADEGSFVHYVEGCSAPVYSSNSLHSAVVEIIALANAHVRYTTIQNWAPNVYNLVTKRAIAYRNAKVEWVDGNFGSKITMKYPSVVLKEPGAKGKVISVAVASTGQHQDAGAKMIHLAPHTSSSIISKSISKNGGRASYRGLVKIIKGAQAAKSHVQCEALILDGSSRSDTYPVVDCKEPSGSIGHEASVNTINDEQLFYLMSKGFSQQQAQTLIINGFIDCFVQLLPMEYAVEINRLIGLEMEGSVG